MRAGKASMIEVRLAKSEVRALTESFSGGASSSGPSMSVKLRAPDGGFIIDSVTPETQWVDDRQGTVEHDFASWRWTVTPLNSGRRDLAMTVSAQVIGSDGTSTAHALPDQDVEVRIARNWGRGLLTLAKWVVIAGLGGAVAKFGAPVYEPAIAAVMKLIT